MTILFTKGRELFEEDAKNQAFKEKPEKNSPAKTRSGKFLSFAKKRK
ncbi:hypothetical protein GCM10007216_33960 [Thalassobacillus devorans]|uniref:Uncharacterized protein n=1 Tax=Thalassobacillus devorans TaxID=279813 RepID=A0ABQ1PP46_9BACI|nr:hypothetical protein [Thalassobacillus devorans]NIK30420.1 hypothetical protein [Thalassobacillus devorans]GGD00422.1 hypothetical protein GCM10007216_33960 [Thalassobacillus devorans]